MKYSYSQLDMDNKLWFNNDKSCASLLGIELRAGKIRGLQQFAVNFEYPITAIAGENGSGKSTILALAACAFHNNKKGYNAGGKSISYYTFSDFFVQSQAEVSPQGILIVYKILYHKWRNAEPGVGTQFRKKNEGGKWNDYDTRVKRNVVYFGVQRVVPHSERSTHKSYRNRFVPGSMENATLERIAQSASRIFSKPYQAIELYIHSKYSLPMANCRGVKYSGFNMGAGECAVFEFLATLFKAGRGTLLVIDEIELGLHEKAQRKLIKELKKLCKEMHCQVICSTHSHVVLEALPPEARYFIDNADSQTQIISGISSKYACGKLSGLNVGELDIFVEDGVASHILQIGLPLSLRERINILPIGSSEAVIRQLTSRYLEGRSNCLALLDGDKHSENSAFLSKLANYSEFSTKDDKVKIQQWGRTKLSYLPGNCWPEKWLIESAKLILNTINDSSSLMLDWGLENDNQTTQLLDEALISGKHSEFHELSVRLCINQNEILSDIIKFVKKNDINFIENIKSMINNMLDG